MTLETGSSRSINGVFLDLCGTLLIYGNMDEAWEEWLEIGFSCFKKSGLNFTRPQFQESCSGLFSKPEPEPEKDGLTVYERRLKRFCREIGHHMSRQELQTTAMATVSIWADHLYLDPDCPAVLESLQKRCKLALITNFDHPPYIELALQKHGLRPYFAEVLISGIVGIKKPDPAIFHLGLKQTGLKASEVIHVGDSLEDDAKGAGAAGIRAVFIRRDPAMTAAAYDYNAPTRLNQALPDSAEMAVHTIRRLTEVLDMV